MVLKHPGGTLAPAQAQALSAAYTWANRPTAASINGLVVRITDVGLGGSHWISDGTYLRPVNGRVVLRQQSGSIASPLAAVTGVTSAMLVPSGPLTIPAGMLIPGVARLQVRASFRRTGANGTALLNIHLGTNKTSGDNTAYAFTYAATTLLDIIAAPDIFIAEAQRYTGTNWQVVGGSGNTSTLNDRTTAFNVASETAITFSVSSANAADSFALIGYSIELVQ